MVDALRTKEKHSIVKMNKNRHWSSWEQVAYIKNNHSEPSLAVLF
jgi:hypothetical protein